MRLMGLDLSLTSTGISMDGVTSVIRSKARGAERLSDITRTVLHECLENEIICVLIEGYSFASRSGQAFSIGELGGCIRMTLFECNIPVVEIPPPVVQSLQPDVEMHLREKLFPPSQQRLGLSLVEHLETTNVMHGFLSEWEWFA